MELVNYASQRSSVQPFQKPSRKYSELKIDRSLIYSLDNENIDLSNIDIESSMNHMIDIKDMNGTFDDQSIMDDEDFKMQTIKNMSIKQRNSMNRK